MPKELVIDVKNLELKAGYRYLLKDINWQVERGENWVVFGMNGSGKTRCYLFLLVTNKLLQGTLPFLVKRTAQKIFSIYVGALAG